MLDTVNNKSLFRLILFSSIMKCLKLVFFLNKRLKFLFAERQTQKRENGRKDNITKATIVISIISKNQVLRPDTVRKLTHKRCFRTDSDMYVRQA